VDVPANTTIHGAVDSVGDVVLFYRDPAFGHYRLVKIDAAGEDTRWAVEYVNLTVTTNSSLNIDPNTNDIWLVYAGFSGSPTVTVEKRAP
jgi:hypothetical protein